MNHLLRPRIWPSSLASSGVGPCDVPFALAALRSVPQAGSQFRGLATAIHEVSWLKDDV
jgi:hypothetical protein